MLTRKRLQTPGNIELIVPASAMVGRYWVRVGYEGSILGSELSQWSIATTRGSFPEFGGSRRHRECGIN